jgi:hypothetical protein
MESSEGERSINILHSESGIKLFGTQEEGITVEVAGALLESFRGAQILKA